MKDIWGMHNASTFIKSSSGALLSSPSRRSHLKVQLVCLSVVRHGGHAVVNRMDSIAVIRYPVYHLRRPLVPQLKPRADGYCFLPLTATPTATQSPALSFLRTVKHAMPRYSVMSLMTRWQNRAYEKNVTARVTYTNSAVLGRLFWIKGGLESLCSANTSQA